MIIHRAAASTCCSTHLPLSESCFIRWSVSSGDRVWFRSCPLKVSGWHRSSPRVCHLSSRSMWSLKYLKGGTCLMSEIWDPTSFPQFYIDSCAACSQRTSPQIHHVHTHSCSDPVLWSDWSRSWSAAAVSCVFTLSDDEESLQQIDEWSINWSVWFEVMSPDWFVSNTWSSSLNFCLTFNPRVLSLK